MKKNVTSPLELPNYAPSEASRYFHIPYSTMEYWTSGGSSSLIKLASRKPPMLSFKNLVEFYVLEGLRQVHGVKLPQIRLAIEQMMRSENSRHPLADYDIKTDGKHVWFGDDPPVNASLRGQVGMAFVNSYLQRVSRDPYGIAQRIHPFIRKEELKLGSTSPRIVEIDPHRCFGMPVLAGSRITTSFLASRYRGGESLPQIADSYGRSVEEIKEAVTWELGREVEAA